MKSPSDKPSVVICLTTHNRTDCAQINCEIIKLNYPDKWPVVHATSNSQYTKTSEDALVQCEPAPLKIGALNLLKESIKLANTEFHPDFIVHLEGDTWMMDPKIIKRYIDLLSAHPKKQLAASRWNIDKTNKWKNSNKKTKRLLYLFSLVLRKFGLDIHIQESQTLSTQFFIFRNSPELRSFFENFNSLENSKMLEKEFYERYTKVFPEKTIIWLPERDPVHPHHRYVCEGLQLFSQHWPSFITLDIATSKADFDKNTPVRLEGKKQVLERYPNLKKGPAMLKLLNSDDLSYYNFGAKRNYE